MKSSHYYSIVVAVFSLSVVSPGQAADTNALPTKPANAVPLSSSLKAGKVDITAEATGAPVQPTAIQPAVPPAKPPAGLKPVPGALPELPSLAIPDLIPILVSPMTAKVGVKNIGSGKSAASVLTIECKNRDPRRSCADSRLMQRYLNPAYPNKIVIQVPALAPGQVWVHALGFWDSLKWAAGHYAFTAMADDGNRVSETNEGNNTSYSSLSVP